MALFGSPAPQWRDKGIIIGAVLDRLILFLDADGYYRFYPLGTRVPSAVIEDDGTGTLHIVASSPSPKSVGRMVATGLTYIRT